MELQVLLIIVNLWSGLSDSVHSMHNLCKITRVVILLTVNLTPWQAEFENVYFCFKTKTMERWAHFHLIYTFLNHSRNMSSVDQLFGCLIFYFKYAFNYVKRYLCGIKAVRSSRNSFYFWAGKVQFMNYSFARKIERDLLENEAV